MAVTDICGVVTSLALLVRWPLLKMGVRQIAMVILAVNNDCGEMSCLERLVFLLR